MKKISARIYKLRDAVALLGAELFVVFILFFVILVFLILLISRIFFQQHYKFDQQAFDFLSAHVTDTHTAILQFFTFFGSHSFLVPIYFIFFTWYFFIMKNKWHFIKLASIAVSNLLLMFGLKMLFNRPRPLIPLLHEVRGLSFPSGHAYMSFVFFGLLIYIIYLDVKNKAVKWTLIPLCILMIFFVGLSRVYLRVHYASDVLAGFCFGFISLVIMLWLLHQIELYNRKKLAAPVNITPVTEPASQ